MDTAVKFLESERQRVVVAVKNMVAQSYSAGWWSRVSLVIDWVCCKALISAYTANRHYVRSVLRAENSLRLVRRNGIEYVIGLHIGDDQRQNVLAKQRHYYRQHFARTTKKLYAGEQ